MKPTADAQYHDLGAGSLLFNRFDANGNPTGFRPLGNCDAFGITATIEEIEKKDNTDGTRKTLIKVITASELSVNITLAEYRPDNLALALLGQKAVLTQAEETVTDEELNGGDPIELDIWYDLDGFKVDVDSVEQSGALSASDYEVNADGTMIRILSTGAGIAAVTTWSGTRPALTGLQVQALTNARILGWLRFVSASNQVAGQRKQVDIFRIPLRPEGEIPFLSEDFGAFTLTGTAEPDPARQPGDDVIRIVPLGDLVETS